jgi:hypothetical protein
MNNALNAVFTFLFFRNQQYHFLLAGNICRMGDNHSDLPYLTLYFIIKLSLTVYAAWQMFRLEKNNVFNLLLINLAVFDLFGGIITYLIQLDLIHFTNVFFSDIYLYLLSGSLFGNHYYVVALFSGIVGAVITSYSFMRYQSNLKHIVAYASGMLSGIIIPLFLMNWIINH